jgi:hypothetical protein
MNKKSTLLAAVLLLGLIISGCVNNSVTQERISSKNSELQALSEPEYMPPFGTEITPVSPEMINRAWQKTAPFNPWILNKNWNPNEMFVVDFADVKLVHMLVRHYGVIKQFPALDNKNGDVVYKERIFICLTKTERLDEEIVERVLVESMLRAIYNRRSLIDAGLEANLIARELTVSDQMLELYLDYNSTPIPEDNPLNKLDPSKT